MIRLILFLIFVFIAFGCEKNNENVLDSEFMAEIVGFDWNCSTCFLAFPMDSVVIRKEIGESENSFYHAINLDKDTLKIGQKLIIKLRKPLDQEIRACITMYPSFNYKNIFITSSKPDI